MCDMLSGYGVAVYVADDRAKELMTDSEQLRSALVAAFGEATYDGGKLNRAYLAESVFSNTEALARLNAIVHPAVMADFDRWANEQEGDYVVLESAILFEAGLDDRVDTTVAVMAPKDIRLQRAMQRDGATREQIERRMDNQLSDDRRCTLSKYAIVNILLEDLQDDVEQLHRRLCYDARAQRA